MKPLRKRQREGGAALMLALWALFVLSAMIMSWALDIDTRLTLAGAENRVLEARAMAASGAEVALHPAVTPASPVLRRQVDAQQSYDVRITGEGGRLNINWVVAGENPQRIELLRRFLEQKGFDLNERDRMIDTLLDWVDADNLVRLQGAEADGDYRPANTLLLRVSDLKLIKGWQEFTSRPGWEDEVTVNSTGPIDLQWASGDLLMSLPGMSPMAVEQFLKLRAGPDGIDGTEDDPPFETIDEVRVALGFSAEQFSRLVPLVAFRDQVLRVVSVGRSGNVTRAVHMVIRKTGAAPQLITWKEL
jgi:type II secretory pathway component PulK